MATRVELMRRELEVRRSKRTLLKMKEMYNEQVHLTGAFASDMLAELNCQIAHCEESQQNLIKAIHSCES